MEPDPSLVNRIDAVLPQTQCRQCGFDGCRPYATAIARGDAEINQCPPGGETGVARIAHVVGRVPMPLNPANGIEKPFALAVIDETLCIGCTLCIQACPVDAIVGAGKRMHDVVADLCTGCELCVPPCPVDCISMVPADFAWDDAHVGAARANHAARSRRLARKAGQPRDDSRIAPGGQRDEKSHVERSAASRKSAILAAAIERAKQRQRARADVERNRG